MADELKITQRHLPHWSHDGATYFITFRVRAGALSFEERTLIFDQIRSGEPRFYQLCALVVMPDHVHVLAMPHAGVDLARMTKGMKGVTARLVNESRGTRGRCGKTNRLTGSSATMMSSSRSGITFSKIP